MPKRHKDDKALDRLEELKRFGKDLKRVTIELDILKRQQHTLQMKRYEACMEENIQFDANTIVKELGNKYSCEIVAK